MKKFLLTLGISVLAFIIIVGIAVGFYLDPLVKIAIQNIGPQITKVTVRVDTVSLSLLTGSAKIKGLVVGNPVGYRTPQAISVGMAFISIDPFSVFSKKVIIHSVRIDSPQITFEGGLAGSNLSRIVKNAAAVAQNPDHLGPASTGPGNKPAPNIEVDDFIISKPKVHVSLKGLGGRQMTLALPDIHLTNLGKEGAGLTPAQLTRAVLSVITTDTVKAVAASVGALSQGLGKLGGSSINTITNTIGSLFGQ